MKYLLSVLIFFCFYQANAEITINSDTLIEATPQESLQIPIQITSDSVDEITRIYITRGYSSQAISCVKSYVASESCSFNLDVDASRSLSFRVMAFSSTGRVSQTIKVNVNDFLQDLTGALEIKSSGQVVNGGINLGTVNLDEEIVRSITIRNIQSKTTKELAPVQLIGSNQYTLRNDNCSGANLKYRHICSFEIVVSPDNYRPGNRDISLNLNTIENQNAGNSGVNFLDISGSFDLTLTSMPANIASFTRDYWYLQKRNGGVDLDIELSIVHTFIPPGDIVSDGQVIQPIAPFSGNLSSTSQSEVSITSNILIPQVRTNIGNIVDTDISFSDPNSSSFAFVGLGNIVLENVYSRLSVYEKHKDIIDDCVLSGGGVYYTATVDILIGAIESRSLYCSQSNSGFVLKRYGYVVERSSSLGDNNSYNSIEDLLAAQGVVLDSQQLRGNSTLDEYYTSSQIKDNLP